MRMIKKWQERRDLHTTRRPEQESVALWIFEPTIR